MCGREVHLQRVSGDLVMGLRDHRPCEERSKTRITRDWPMPSAAGSQASWLSSFSIALCLEALLFLLPSSSTHSQKKQCTLMITYGYWAGRLRVWGQAIRQGTSFRLAEVHHAICQLRDLCSDSGFRSLGLGVQLSPSCLKSCRSKAECTGSIASTTTSLAGCTQ